MPSPISHAAFGFAIYRLWKKSDTPSRRIVGVVPAALLVCVGLSILPDLDAAVGIVLGNLGRYHNNFAGTPVFGTLVALAAGLAVALARRPGALSAFNLTFICYQVHILMDFLTIGRGLMLFWPLSDERVKPPFYLFYGLRWSDGLISDRHLITVFSEIATIGAIVVLVTMISAKWNRR